MVRFVRMEKRCWRHDIHSGLYARWINSAVSGLQPQQGLDGEVRSYPSNSFTGSPVRSSSELAILTGLPMGLMYSFVQSIPSVLYTVA